MRWQLISSPISSSLDPRRDGSHFCRASDRISDRRDDEEERASVNGRFCPRGTDCLWRSHLVFGTRPNLAHAAIVTGLLDALTPISIVLGAIFFFVALERSGAMETLRLWLNGVSRNRVAQLMVVGWSFQFLIEGASGFGTPAALAAPVLVGLGFPPLRVAVLCLVMNSVPVSFGAVGTPTWFGFSSLELPEAQLLHIGLKTALLHAAAAVVIPEIALRFVVGWKEIRRNLLFVQLSVFACVLPMVAIAAFNYEFPAVAGGMIGLLMTIFLAQHRIGLAKEEGVRKPRKPAPCAEAMCSGRWLPFSQQWVFYSSPEFHFSD